MDFQLTPEHQRLQQAVREIVGRFDAGYWQELDRSQSFPEELWGQLAQHGYLGVAIPKKYGGLGFGMLEMSLIVEEIAAAGAGALAGLLYVLTPVFGGISLNVHGSEEQKASYLPRIARGELEFALGMTEAEAGTNTLAVQTTATRCAGGYRITGMKNYVSAMQRAKGIVIVARTSPASPEKRTSGLSLFVADPTDPAVTYQPVEKVGLRYVYLNRVWFNDLFVPEEARLGEEGNGWRLLLDTLNPERICLTAGSIGTGELALRLASAFARERVVFGRPIGSNQGIQFPLARHKAELEAARLLNHKAAWLYDTGQPCGAEANMATLVGTQAGFAATDRAMQTLGGAGYLNEGGIERLWRDARLFQIAPITQEMTLSYVAEHVLGLPKSY